MTVMASCVEFFFWLLMILLCPWSHLLSCGSSDLFQPDYLMVPVSEFSSSLETAINAIQNVTSTVSQFSHVSNDFHLSNAISDCLELLDLSAELLDWTLSASLKPDDGTRYGTGDLGFDFRTWLNGVLVNQDTCLEGFDGTSGTIKSLVEERLSQVTSLVTGIRDTVHLPPDSMRGGRNPTNHEQTFPSWLKHEEKKLLLQPLDKGSADVVVAADGTGNFTKISDAINLVPKRSSRRFVIYIKRGVYQEYVEIDKKKWNVALIGDGIDATVITGNRNAADGFKSYKSGTFRVKGRGFIARDITFQNTAGPQKAQAIAFLSDSDLSAIYRCAFRGYQDTLYAHNLRQFYKSCLITGTVDFIFGRSTAVFQSCQIRARKGLPQQKNAITAQGRKEPGDGSGFSIQFSHISAEPDVTAANIETYLGRPWKLYSRTVILQSYISSAIHPKGWLPWNGSFALGTLYYGEYMNFGPGARLDNRVNWPGFHEIQDPSVANKFTVAKFILGDSWLPSTGIQYTDGLQA
ncbi:probable pectinesterase/pectinesterase inhibitor 32 [Coffea arabica]|uniref:Pectinesterase n=1 Tax=Coffea arabica TaxID=13443 RepID=A0ABM4UNZ2_COFAR|nr:probable pectinesterase/pectinesterase inhibitor 32 [Coffea arabica]